jgi:hypothetical protein
MIRLEMYGDFWFDNGLELLGHEMSRAGMSVTFREGLKFEKPTSGQIRKLAKLLDERADSKLFYARPNETGKPEIKRRTKMPVFHQKAARPRMIVGFIGKPVEEKEKLLQQMLQRNEGGLDCCDICTRKYAKFGEDQLGKVSQTIYPFVTTSLKSCCGVRKMSPEYRACLTCVVIGSLAWVDDVPFFTDLNNHHSLIIPVMDDLTQLHKFKVEMRRHLNESMLSNVMRASAESGKSNWAPERPYDLLLLLFEKLKFIESEALEFGDVLCRRWVYLRVDSMKLVHAQEIEIPNLEALKRVFHAEPDVYSGFVRKAFAAPLKEGIGKDMRNERSAEVRGLLARGLLTDDFSPFAEAFTFQNNMTASVNYEILTTVIKAWRCP